MDAFNIFQGGSVGACYCQAATKLEKIASWLCLLRYQRIIDAGYRWSCVGSRTPGYLEPLVLWYKKHLVITLGSSAGKSAPDGDDSMRLVLSLFKNRFSSQ